MIDGSLAHLIATKRPRATAETATDGAVVAVEILSARSFGPRSSELWRSWWDSATLGLRSWKLKIFIWLKMEFRYRSFYKNHDLR